MAEEQNSTLGQKRDRLPIKTIIAAVMMLVYGFCAIIPALSGRLSYFFIDIFPPILMLICALLFIWRKESMLWWGCVVSLAINIFQALFYTVIFWWDWDVWTEPIFLLWLILALVLLLNDMKLYFKYDDKTRGSEPVEWTKRRYIAPVALVIGIIVLLGAGVIALIWYDASRDAGHGGRVPYTSVRSEIENAVTAYSSNSSHLGQFPILSGNITVGNTIYYVIDFNQLLIGSGGLMKTMPTGLANVSVGNDNCNGADSRCENTSHYVWMVDKTGNIISICINGSRGGCNAANKDGYQGVWP